MARNNETTTKFKVDISELKSAMQEAKRQISIANSEFKAVSSSMDNWAKSSDGLKAKLNQLGSNLKSQKSILQSLESQYELTVDEMGEGSAEADRLKIAINNQKATINKTEKEISKFEDSLEDVSEAEEIASRTGKDVSDVLDDMGKEAEDAEKSVANLSDGFTVMKGALADLVADGIRNAINAVKDLAGAVVDVGSGFSSSMAEVQAISGASAEELELLEATAREFGATTVFSASESADALKYMALAGWDAETSASALGGVLNLASASGMDLAQASDMVTDYLSAFGLEAKDSAMFADMLAYAQGNSNTSAEQLGEAFKNCAGVLNSGGQDVQTTTALLASMANQGLKGSEAGTALTAVMRDMTNKMKDGSIAIGDTSVQVMDANGNYRDLTDILKDVETATEGMGDAERAVALGSTFTADSIKGLNLILNDGVGNAENFEEALRNSSGTAETMSATMNDNLAGDVKAFQSALEELALKVYDALEPALRDIIAFVQELADEFNAWLADPANKEAIDELSTNIKDFVTGALTDIKEFIKWFIENKDLVIAGIVAIGTGLMAWNVVTMIQGLVTAFKAWQVATEDMTVAQKLLNLVMKANPIAIVITLITALVAGFIYLWNTSDEFRAFWINLWEKVKEITSNVVDAVVEFFTVKLPEAINNMVDWFTSIPDKFSEILEAIVTYFSQLPAKIWTWLVNVITNVATWVQDMKTKAKEAGKNFLDNVINFIKDLPSKVWTWLTNTISKIKTFVSDMKTKATEAGKGFFDNIVNGIKDLPNKVKTIGSDVVAGLWNGINDKVQWLKDKISGFVGDVTSWLKKFFGIGSPSKLMADEVGKWLPAGIAVGIDKNAKTAINSIKGMAVDMVGATSKGFSSSGISGGVAPISYTQIINSPKQLSRLEIYRQSKNLLGYAGGGF